MFKVYIETNPGQQYFMYWANGTSYSCNIHGLLIIHHFKI